MYSYLIGTLDKLFFYHPIILFTKLRNYRKTVGTNLRQSPLYYIYPSNNFGVLMLLTRNLKLTPMYILIKLIKMDLIKLTSLGFQFLPTSIYLEAHVFRFVCHKNEQFWFYYAEFYRETFYRCRSQTSKRRFRNSTHLPQYCVVSDERSIYSIYCSTFYFYKYMLMRFFNFTQGGWWK